MDTSDHRPNRFPTLFVPHGAPTFALRPGAAGAALADISSRLPRPRAIVIASPHWETALPTVGSASRLDTIHDFRGFPEALYAIRYPASGCPEAAREVADAIRAAGLPVNMDAERGLDHGAWVPLRLMYPHADVPVVPLSIQPQAGPEGAWSLGHALAGLTDRGFLIIGSGNITHNLRDYMLARAGQGAPEYVHSFPAWIADRLAEQNLAALLDYRRQAADAVRAHPSEEHLLPLMLALGAAGKGARAARFHAGIDDYVLAMDAWIFTAGAA